MNNVFRSVCVGDLHYDALNKYNSVFRLQGRTYNQLVSLELRKAYDYAERNGIEHVVLLGDLAERPTMSQEAHMEFLATLLDAKYRKFQTWIIVGNHDFEDTTKCSMDPLRQILNKSQAFPHIHLFDKTPQKVVQDGMDIGFLPYPHVNLLTPQDRPVAYFGHFDVKGARKDNGTVIDYGQDESLDTQDFWTIGHIHTFQTPRKNVVLPGTMHQLNFGESVPKGFLDISFKYEQDRLQKRYDWIENTPGYLLENVIIENENDFDKVTDNNQILYKLFVKKGLDIPQSLSNRPNVVNSIQFKEGHLEVVRSMELRIESTDSGAIVWDEDQEIRRMLKQEHGLSEAKIARGLELLATIPGKLPNVA